MAETATVGLNQRDETNLCRHALGCRINGTYIEPLMTGPWKSMTEFEFEGNTCLLPARVSAETLQKISELPVDKTDTFVTGFAKSGRPILELVVYFVVLVVRGSRDRTHGSLCYFLDLVLDA